MFSTLPNGTKEFMGVAAVDIDLKAFSSLLDNLNNDLFGSGSGSGLMLLLQRKVVCTDDSIGMLVSETHTHT